MDSPNLRIVKEIWDAFDRDGLDGGLEALIAACADDVEARPYSSHGTVLRGPAKLREFWQRASARGDWVRAGAYEFTERGDDVVVRGWVRLSQAGGLSDSQVRWIFTLRDGRIVRAAAEPLGAA